MRFGRYLQEPSSLFLRASSQLTHSQLPLVQLAALGTLHVPQQVVQAVAAAVRTTAPGARLPEGAQERKGEGLVEDEQRILVAGSGGRRRVEEGRRPRDRDGHRKRVRVPGEGASGERGRLYPRPRLGRARDRLCALGRVWLPRAARRLCVPSTARVCPSPSSCPPHPNRGRGNAMDRAHDYYQSYSWHQVRPHALRSVARCN